MIGLLVLSVLSEFSQVENLYVYVTMSVMALAKFLAAGSPDDDVESLVHSSSGDSDWLGQCRQPIGGTDISPGHCLGD